MSYGIVPRTSIGFDPVVRDSDGDPRPRLANEQYYTCHYTGVNVIYASRNAPQAIRDIEAYAKRNGKPNEYNYVIAQQNDNNIYEYAGPFQAAHSAGENDESVGVLFLNGISEPPTNLQIDKWRWLRDRHLIPSGILRASPDQRQHRQMPGAATSCPGQLIVAKWAEFLLPYANGTPTPPPPPPPIGVRTVLLYKVVSGDSYWRIVEKVSEDGKATNARVTALQQANSSRALRPGDIINVPGRVAV